MVKGHRQISIIHFVNTNIRHVSRCWSDIWPYVCGYWILGRLSGCECPEGRLPDRTHLSPSTITLCALIWAYFYIISDHFYWSCIKSLRTLMAHPAFRLRWWSMYVVNCQTRRLKYRWRWCSGSVCQALKIKTGMMVVEYDMTLTVHHHHHHIQTTKSPLNFYVNLLPLYVKYQAARTMLFCILKTVM